MIAAALAMIENESDKEFVLSLYEKNELFLYNIAYNILHNRTDAEDAVQDAFVRVINHLEKIREIDCNETRFYLVVIVKNVSLNMLKKKQRHPEINIDEVYDVQTDDNIEDEILDKINSEEIRNALRELSDNDYEILFLYLVKEHNLSEIADLIGISANLARQRIFRARKRLIKLLGKRGITNEI